VKISKKFGVMEKPATYRKSDFTVLSFFYAPSIQKIIIPEEGNKLIVETSNLM
jgi:hypothetical protein